MRPSPLAVYRFASGYSQRELAERAGVVRETVTNVESGKTRPTLRTAQAIATALGIASDVLFPPNDDGPALIPGRVEESPRQGGRRDAD